MNTDSALRFSDNHTKADILVGPGILCGSVQVPCSKSLAHRALICASLAEGTSHLSRLTFSRDIEATMKCMQALGAKIQPAAGHPDELLVKGSTAFVKSAAPLKLYADESGSTLRFLIPVAAASSAPITFLGEPSLLMRPMGIYADVFLNQDLPFVQSPEGISFHGPLQPGLFTLPGNVSSQFISGLLFAAPLLQGEVSIAVLPPYQSRSYTGLTVSMMKIFGIHIDEPTENGYTLPAFQHYHSADYAVEGDYSQAAFFAVSAAIEGEITLKGMNPDSLQGDAVILSILEKAGARLEWDGDTLRVSHHQLIAQTIDLADCPDLGPILCVLAAYTPGTTRLIHAARLRYKECDRIAAMEENLKAWGVEVTSDEDSMTITGKKTWSAEEPVKVSCFNDHRIAMAMAVFAAHARTNCILESAQAVSKSYPDFFRDFVSLHGKAELYE